MADMKVTLSLCFDRLQDLQIKPTKDNMEILLQTLYDLRDVYKRLEEMDNAGSENGSAVNAE